MAPCAAPSPRCQPCPAADPSPAQHPTAAPCLPSTLAGHLHPLPADLFLGEYRPGLCNVFLCLLLHPGPIHLVVSAPPGTSSASVPVPNSPACSFPGGRRRSPRSSPLLMPCSLCTSFVQAEPALAGPHQCYVTGLRQPSPVASRALGEG